MKRIRFWAILMALCLLACGVAGCGTTQGADEVPAATSTTTNTDESTTETAATSTESAPAAGDTTTATPSATDGTTTQTTGKTQGGSATTKKTTTTTSGKKVITHTTEQTTTTTTKDKSKGKAIKILAIGNSFSVDAMNNHLFSILESAGYTDITLGNLYIGGCDLNTHYDNLKKNNAAYEYYKNTDGAWSKYANTTPGSALTSVPWDVVTIQQVSSDSGRPQAYTNLQSALDIIKQKAPRAKIYWHMTWAYQQNSDHWAFQYYNKDQATMYSAICDTVQSQVLTKSDIAGFIPSGTAIQNLRTSGLGDTLTSDGHHLKDSYGDYTAALTWFCTLTGEKPEAVTYWPSAVSGYKDEIIQSVKNALKEPLSVTKCK